MALPPRDALTQVECLFDCLHRVMHVFSDVVGPFQEYAYPNLAELKNRQFPPMVVVISRHLWSGHWL